MYWGVPKRGTELGAGAVDEVQQSVRCIGSLCERGILLCDGESGSILDQDTDSTRTRILGYDCVRQVALCEAGLADSLEFQTDCRPDMIVYNVRRAAVAVHVIGRLSAWTQGCAGPRSLSPWLPILQSPLPTTLMIFRVQSLYRRHGNKTSPLTLVSPFAIHSMPSLEMCCSALWLPTVRMVSTESIETLPILRAPLSLTTASTAGFHAMFLASQRYQWIQSDSLRSLEHCLLTSGDYYFHVPLAVSTRMESSVSSEVQPILEDADTREDLKRELGHSLPYGILLFQRSAIGNFLLRCRLMTGVLALELQSRNKWSTKDARHILPSDSRA
nr:hypothetical protein CFP56_74425 [Quercus suber]